jgi:hypothetical protein
MNKIKFTLLAIFPGIALALLLMMAFTTLLNADNVNAPEPITKAIEPQVIEPLIIKVYARAFNAYGNDINGVDYGPGYVVISDKSEIPIYSLLDIDIYGECQAIGVSNKLAKDEIRLWYNSPSKVMLFEPQMAFVRVLGMGDTPVKERMK